MQILAGVALFALVAGIVIPALTNFIQFGPWRDPHNREISRGAGYTAMVVGGVLLCVLNLIWHYWIEAVTALLFPFVWFAFLYGLNWAETRKVRVSS